MDTEQAERELPDEPSIDFSIEELVAIAEILELRGVPGLGANPLAFLDPGVHEAVLASARRALVARRFLIPTETGAFEVARPVAHIVARVARSGIQVRAVYEAGGRVETRWFAAEPDLGVEHGVAIGTVQRLTPFRTEQLLARVLEFCGIATRPENSAPSFAVSAVTLTNAVEVLAARDADGATKVLTAGGADEKGAIAFVRALQQRVASASATILHRPAENVIGGGELTWLDCADEGLWITPALGDQDNGGSESAETGGLLTVAPTSAKYIAKELLSYLPGEPVGG